MSEETSTPTVELVNWGKEFQGPTPHLHNAGATQAIPRWKVRALWVFVVWLIANVVSAVWHLCTFDETRNLPHVWVCQRSNAVLIYDSDVPYMTFASPWTVKLGRSDFRGLHSWRLVSPRQFTPCLPWNWLSFLVIPSRYDPEEMWEQAIRPPPRMRVT